MYFVPSTIEMLLWNDYFDSFSLRIKYNLQSDGNFEPFANLLHVYVAEIICPISPWPNWSFNLIFFVEYQIPYVIAWKNFRSEERK